MLTFWERQITNEQIALEAICSFGFNTFVEWLAHVAAFFISPSPRDQGVFEPTLWPAHIFPTDSRSVAVRWSWHSMPPATPEERPEGLP